MTRSVIVAGGTGGLGSAVTAELLTAGWRVVVPGRSEQSLAALGTHEALAPIVADLSDPAGAADVVALATAEPEAPLAALVNLVGGFAAGPRVHETPVEDFERQLALNLRPLYLITQAAVPHLIANGGGAIVCTSSQTALKPFSGAAGYVTAKAGVLAFADTLAVEYAKDHLRVNTLLPGVIDTPANRRTMPNADPAGWTPPSRIAGVVRYLIENEGITGARLPV
ncbi:short-chain dehydrogenase/reductase SDR [Kribbella flavida DSM 17836]|uniref:Short-chain dehydrogenase/reductase SDR n=1 Tax=Kribbella flavida (strain DSM 17836 / JCM 10339 / NBRC 14399) TaxID=479435 RepID=D2PQD8_KRIFD|nr:SDR family NAD(P)-dependent oxidoreductase [Kribbella flavida]ADB34840.1 short-chain dehydrogenase/reductase SDR [Kribbella flavida DSM 17836]